MKILLISPTQSGIGGVAQHVQGLKKFLESQGNYVEIISSENTLTIPIKGLKNPSFMISSLLKSKFKKNFDIVHAHNIPSAYAMKNVPGKKILTQHGIFSEQIDHLHGKTSGNLSHKFEKNALTWADAITVISKEAFDYYSKMGFHTMQIPNAIDFDNLPQGVDKRFEKQIIFVGRISKEKGTETILELSKKLPNDINFLIVGSGPESEQIKKLSDEIKNVHYLGYQNHENSIKLIRGSDMLIQPSIHEGISTTLLEAMFCKTPIITTAVGGNLELFEHQTNGLLVEHNDSDSFLEYIEMLFSDSLLAKNLSDNAFVTVQQYDWKIIGQKYLALYNSLL